MAESEFQPPVIILGMHRSGTSIITRLLEQLGLFIGAQLDENDEAIFFSRLNTWILACSGGRWDTPRSMEYLLADEPGLELTTDYLRQRVKGLSGLGYLGVSNVARYGSMFRMRRAWGWKDPSNTITLPIWLKLFPHARLIHVVRNGVDIADSLYRRQQNGFAAAQQRYERFKWLIPIIPKQGWFGESPRVMDRRAGFDLWEEYLAYAERFTRPVREQLIELRYEDFVAQPEVYLKQLAEFCGLCADPAQIAHAAQSVRREKSFGFAANPVLYSLWQEIRDTPWMVKYGYDTLAPKVAPAHATPPAVREPLTVRTPSAVKRILLLDDASDPRLLVLEPGYYTAIVCLFWAAPETVRGLAAQSGGACYSLSDIIQDPDHWERKATELVQDICSAGPEYRGLKWRSYLAESLFQEALHLVLAQETVRFVQGLCGDSSPRATRVESVMAAPLEKNLRLVLSHLPDAFPLERASVNGAPTEYESLRPALPKRLLRRWREVRITGNWRRHFWEMSAQLDARYYLRALVERYLPMPNIPTGGLTLFSSYGNNSRILSSIEPLLTKPVTWVLTNDSSRRGVINSAAPRFWLWQFASRKNEIPEPIGQTQVELATHDPARVALLQAWLESLPLWKSWLHVQLPALAQLTRFWECYLERAKPTGVLMAEQWGLEGWLMAVARRRNIPVIQLLHGALGGYFYTQVPIQSDALVVWGNFWRDLFAPAERKKIYVYTPPGLFRRVTRRPSDARHLVFFSWPLSSLPYYNRAELSEGILDILHTLIQAGVWVTVRAHPAENPADFIESWRQRYGELPTRLHLDKHGDLAELLAQTDIALMFRSTVMLDCLVNNIPIVMPGWIEFGWNHELYHLRGVHLARTWADLRATLQEWIQHPPTLDPNVISSFVETDSNGAHNLSSLLNQTLFIRELA